MDTTSNQLSCFNHTKDNFKYYSGLIEEFYYCKDCDNKLTKEQYWANQFHLVDKKEALKAANTVNPFKILTTQDILKCDKHIIDMFAVIEQELSTPNYLSLLSNFNGQIVLPSSIYNELRQAKFTHYEFFIEIQPMRMTSYLLKLIEGKTLRDDQYFIQFRSLP